MSRSSERVYPYLISLLGAGLFWYLSLPFPKGQDILSASITVAAVFVGFLATSESIVISLQSPTIEHFKATKFFPLLLQYLQEAIWISLTYCAFSLFGFFHNADAPPHWFGPIWVFLSIATLLAFQRISQALIRLLRNS
jgi:hypothetical protein